MRTPIYFQSKKNSIANCRYLTEMQRYGKINETGDRSVKGGCCDHNGGPNPNSTGGGNRTENIRRNGEASTAQGRDARLQSWQRMARIQIRVRGVEKDESESIQTGSGKLNISSSVAHLRPGKAWNPGPSRRRCLRYLAAYYRTLHNMWQGLVGHAVAVGGIHYDH